MQRRQWFCGDIFLKMSDVCVLHYLVCCLHLHEAHVQRSPLLIYHNYTYSRLYLGKQLIFSILPSRLALKIHLSRSIPSSPTTLPPPACFSSRPTIILCKRLPGCESSTTVIQQSRWTRPHLWEISSADNTSPHCFNVSSHCCQRSMKGCFYLPLQTSVFQWVQTKRYDRKNDFVA